MQTLHKNALNIVHSWAEQLLVDEGNPLYELDGATSRIVPLLNIGFCPKLAQHKFNLLITRKLYEKRPR
jgi:hypothetical protein